MYGITLRVNIIVCALFIYSHAEVAHKRLPLGFQGMRGKKNIDMSALDELQDYDHPLSLTRLQNYLMAQQPDHYYSPYKRAPMGFMGMRGKKEDAFDGSFYPNSLPEDLYGFNNEEKRGLKSFQGMRGKKQIEFPILSYPNKRKPMGFQGMRGKKDNTDDLLNLYEGEAKTADSDNFFTNPSNLSPYYMDAGFADDEFEKRGGLRGFQGMRGKRGFDADQDKRAPSGFMGMRGKKDDNEDKPELTVEDTDDQSKPSGMKEVVGTTILPTANLHEQFAGLDNFGNGDMASNLMAMHAVKRSPNYGFFGVRGKKMPSFSSYFGTRGKKGPYEYSSFRGKFVGVRGKKSDVYQQYADRLLMAEEYQKRRGPSGFVGMRGKKSITPDDAALYPGKEGINED